MSAPQMFERLHSQWMRKSRTNDHTEWEIKPNNIVALPEQYREQFCGDNTGKTVTLFDLDATPSSSQLKYPYDRCFVLNGKALGAYMATPPYKKLFRAFTANWRSRANDEFYAFFKHGDNGVMINWTERYKWEGTFRLTFYGSFQSELKTTNFGITYTIGNIQKQDEQGRAAYSLSYQEDGKYRSTTLWDRVYKVSSVDDRTTSKKYEKYKNYYLIYYAYDDFLWVDPDNDWFQRFDATKGQEISYTRTKNSVTLTYKYYDTDRDENGNSYGFYVVGAIITADIIEGVAGFLDDSVLKAYVYDDPDGLGVEEIIGIENIDADHYDKNKLYAKKRPAVFKYLTESNGYIKRDKDGVYELEGEIDQKGRPPRKVEFSLEIGETPLYITTFSADDIGKTWGEFQLYMVTNFRFVHIRLKETREQIDGSWGGEYYQQTPFCWDVSNIDKVFIEEEYTDAFGETQKRTIINPILLTLAPENAPRGIAHQLWWVKNFNTLIGVDISNNAPRKKWYHTLIRIVLIAIAVAAIIYGMYHIVDIAIKASAAATAAAEAAAAATAAEAAGTVAAAEAAAMAAAAAGGASAALATTVGLSVTASTGWIVVATTFAVVNSVLGIYSGMQFLMGNTGAEPVQNLAEQQSGAQANSVELSYNYDYSFNSYDTLFNYDKFFM
ncbi:MAG: hypothetical protein LBN32_00375 [Helicobacteraceae bacterium]|nr:hypothetical protein [Helicobacteraceae bacterium]